MNVYDSEQMSKLLGSIGYNNTADPADADMVIINTCHIREKAAEKLFCDLGRIAKIKETRLKKDADRAMIVAVAGCVAQAEGAEIIRRAKVVDIVVGPESYHTLPDLVGKITREKQIELEFSPIDKFDALRNIGYDTASAASAFLTVQEGCDKFCTFCVVPYTRGVEFSRPVNDIYDEALKLADNGACEIYLLGQNVNAYHGIDQTSQTNFDLAKLIRKIAEIPSIKRIRYTTSHPRDMNDELIAAHAEVEKLMPFLHLPVQSGSNAILKAMNRKHAREEYFKIIEKIRKYRPDIGLSSDFIVGFPGETDQDFKDTLDLIKQVEFAQCYSFKYSMRPGTPAANAPNQIPEEVKIARLAELQALVLTQQLKFNEKSVGKVVPVLFETSKKSERKNQIKGRSPHLQSVIVNDYRPELLNQILDVKIVRAGPNSINGELV